MTPVQNAFAANIGRPEKLVLVYLAWGANQAGFGVWDRDAMEVTLGYKRRSMQRTIKALKDEGLLEDLGEWYHIKGKDMHSHAVVSGPPAGVEVRQYVASEATIVEGREADDVTLLPACLDARLDDVIAHLEDSLMNSEARVRSDVNRVGFGVMGLKTLLDNRDSAPKPPPDPVLESEAYAQLLEMGVGDELAYKTAETLLKALANGEASKEDEKINIAEEATSIAAPQFEDSPDGRMQRIVWILTDGATKTTTAEIVKRWHELELGENRYTVAGETDAFELLYPSIVEAARRNIGMSVEVFLDPGAIKANRAPWDLDPAPNHMEDPALEDEIRAMLAALAAANDPRLEVQPRNTDVATDGTPLTETIEAYHRRVKRMYDQLGHMKATGAI